MRPCPSPRTLVSVVAGGHRRSRLTPPNPIQRPPTSPRLRTRPARAAEPPRRQAAGPAPIVFQLGLVARPCPRHGPYGLADGFRPLAQTRRRPAVARRAGAASTSARRSAGRRSSRNGRRSASGMSLRQGRQDDTIQAIAPDAAALRSRHVARRMDCGSSWTLLSITAVAVLGVGRAQVAARCAVRRSQL